MLGHDVLYMQFKKEGSIFVLFLPILGCLEEVNQELMVNDTMVWLVERINEDPNPHTRNTWNQDTIWYKEHIFLALVFSLKES